MHWFSWERALEKERRADEWRAGQENRGNDEVMGFYGP